MSKRAHQPGSIPKWPPSPEDGFGGWLDALRESQSYGSRYPQLHREAEPEDESDWWLEI